MANFQPIIISIKVDNILQSTAGAYSKFANRFVAATFRIDNNVEVLRINGTPAANFYTIPNTSNVIIPNVNDSNKPIYNWNYLVNYNLGKTDPYNNSFWKIPTNPYISEFYYNAQLYYTLFGQFDSSGTLIPGHGLGTSAYIDVQLLNSAVSISLYDFKIECLPALVPGMSTVCPTVVTYYNTNGLVTINI